MDVAPGVAEITHHESQRLEEIGLTGKAVVTVAMDMGPKKPPVSEFMIVLQRPVEGVIKLREPVAEVIYVQEGLAWKTTPTDAALDWRTVELYSIKDATVISVWKGLGRRFSFQAVNCQM